MSAIDLHLQPKQDQLLNEIEHGTAAVIGVGGGRGAAKSGGADRVALALMISQPGCVCCIVMRNADQVRKYHIEPMMRDFPVLVDYLHGTDKKLTIPTGGKKSELDYSYAESLADVERRFRSANYRYIIIDQAEQFTWHEINEILLANRSKGKQMPKAILLFNMGGISIGDLRNRFGPKKKFNENEDPSQYTFIHVYPWDNVEWARNELEREGYTEDEYYSWTDDQRFHYFTTRTAYGKKLNSLDPAIRSRDLLGSWESVEGAYFWRSFDAVKTMISADQADSIIRPWDNRWLSQDWGKTHFCSTHWHGQSKLTPREIKDVLGWEVDRPLNVVVTYRRMIVSGLTSPEVGKKIVAATPVKERERLNRFFMSPEQFGERDSENTVPINLGKELLPFGMPEPEQSDSSRKPGWELMDEVLNATRLWATPPEERVVLLAELGIDSPGDTVWLISSECPEILDALPLLMRNSRDLDDVVKTDMSQTDMKMDVADDCFVAGTMIQTEHGQVPIECIRAGDLVWTSFGLRKVLNSWLARKSARVVKASFSNGSEVVCTPDHRFSVGNNQFKPLTSVSYSDRIQTWNQLHTREPYTDPKLMVIGEEATKKCSTEKSGQMRMEIFLRGWKYTIKTMTKTITTYQTWRFYRKANIARYMVACEHLQKKSWLDCAVGTPHGEKRKYLSGLEKQYQKESVKTSRSKAVLTAVKNFMEGVIACIVRVNAGARLRKTSQEVVRFVDQPTSLTNTNQQHTAQESVVRLLGLQEAGFADVYDLEVEHDPEFYANGVLVHNCRYGLLSMLRPGRKPKKVQFAEEVLDMHLNHADPQAIHMKHLTFLAQQKQSVSFSISGGRRRR